jgi:GMP synthase-like glutamine amidotransferase
MAAMRVLAVANRNDPDLGYVGERLAERGATIDRTWRDDLSDHFPVPGAHDVVVSLGSDWSVYSERVMIEVRHEARYMRAAVDGGVPVLGLCYGGQLLAHALGGSVEPAPEPEFGWHEVLLAGTSHTSGAGGPIEPGPYLQWHVDRFTPPSGARVLARTSAAIQAFSIRGSLGLQFHPEATPEMVGQWVESGRAELDGRGIDAEALLADTERRAPEARARAHRLVDAFLDGAFDR